MARLNIEISAARKRHGMDIFGYFYLSTMIFHHETKKTWSWILTSSRNSLPTFPGISEEPGSELLSKSAAFYISGF